MINLNQTIFYFLSSIGILSAQESTTQTDTSDVFQLDLITVLGEKEGYDLPGSSFLIDSEIISSQGHSNINRILNRVPGVYAREEDGFGLFPNISIRGGDGTRNEKATVMEDGILMAPAPYSAPGAYYSPKIGRTHNVEILKGSSQVKYGPHTTGGVINFTSTPIPEDHNFYFKGIYGSDNRFTGLTHYGDIIDYNGAKIGFLGELYYERSDGFRTIEKGLGFDSSESTGFSLIEPMFKLSLEPHSTIPQRIEFKYGYSDLDADETYVGLTERDLERKPYARYAGTKFDNIQSEHHRTHLKYSIEPKDNIQLEFAGYYNSFERNWYKIRRTGGESIPTVLANPNSFSREFSILKGQTSGDLGIRANAREYELYGAQVQGQIQFNTGNIAHDLGFGIRAHHDEIRRFQRDDSIILGDGGNFQRISRGEPGSGGNRYQEAEALAIWIEDKIELGALTLRPGIRYETVDLSNTDFESNSRNIVTAQRDGNIDYWAPGIGFTYDLQDTNQLFGGIYRGVSVPGPRSVLRSGVDVEESIGYELGIRHESEKYKAELVGFYTDFDNLIGSDTGLGGSDAVNAGEAEVFGAEFLFSTNSLSSNLSGFRLPAFLSATYTSATLTNALSEGGSDNIFAGGLAGADIPYIPDFKVTAGIGIENDKYGINLEASYINSSFGTARNLNSPDNSSRQGIIDSALLVDISAHYWVSDRLKVFGGVQNLLDEQNVVARIPEGPRNGAPIQWYVGIEYKF